MLIEDSLKNRLRHALRGFREGEKRQIVAAFDQMAEAHEELERRVEKLERQLRSSRPKP